MTANFQRRLSRADRSLELRLHTDAGYLHSCIASACYRILLCLTHLCVLLQWEFIANFTPPVDIPSSLYSVQYTPTYLYGALNSSLRSVDQVNFDARALFLAASATDNYAAWKRPVMFIFPRIDSCCLLPQSLIC